MAGVPVTSEGAGLVAVVDLWRGDLTLSVSVSVAPGEVLAVVGPNGAGKTTLCHALAGLVPLQGGRVELGRACLEDPSRGIRVDARHRRIGVVFQDLRLLAGRTATENVALGLRLAGMGRSPARTEARRWLERMGVGHRAGVPARELSGGEAQKVALARALAPRPAALVADEALGALDMEARAPVRRILVDEVRSYGGPCLLVTHDPLEAVVMGGRILVIENGRVSQLGTPADLRSRPASPYVAALVGLNLFDGELQGSEVLLGSGARIQAGGTGSLPLARSGGTGRVRAVIHPRSVVLSVLEPHTSARNTWPVRVASLEPLAGGQVRVVVGGPVPLVAEVTAEAVSDLGLTPGVEVWASVKASEVTLHRS